MRLRGLIGVLFSILCVWGLFRWSYTVASAIADNGSTFPLSDDGGAGQGEESADLGKLMHTTAIEPDDTLSEKIQQALGIAYGSAHDQRATYYVQQLLNWFLAITWFVAVCVLLFWFYKMFFAKDNAEALKSALSIVKWALIALIVIGISRYIVSIMFDVFFTAKEDIG